MADDPKLPVVAVAQQPSEPSPNLTAPNIASSFGPVPVMNDGMTFREVGNSGLRAFAGYVREEFLPQLQGRQAMTVYREMADNSPIIGAIIFAIQATMKKVEWRTVPANDTPAAEEAAEFADSLRLDMSGTWEDTVSEVLSMLTYGFAPLEIVYKKRLGYDPGPDPKRPGKNLPKSKFDDGKVGWRRLPLRGQDTVIKWFFDENGETEGMTQQPWTGPLIDIPIQKMLLFRPSQHKNNPEGRSILRNAYRSYYLTKRIEEQEAILFERMNGLPVIRVPGTLMETARGTGPEAAAALQALNTFKAIAVNLRVDEQMGLVLPSDVFEGPNGPTSVRQYELELIAPGGNGGRSSTQGDPTIIRHQNNMLMSVLADFLSLGHGQTGTQALSVSKQDMFFQAVEGYLNSSAAVFNRHGLPRAWELNGMDPDLLPEFTPDLAQNVDLDMLGNFVNRLAASGMALFPNGDLEGALMDAAGLPDIADPAMREQLEADGEDGPVAIAGPMAAIAVNDAIPQPGMPGGPPLPEQAPPGKKSNFEKMLWGSVARRIQKRGPSMSINTKRPLPIKR